MKKNIILLLFLIIFIKPCFAIDWFAENNEEKAIKRVFNSQLKYANRADFKKFIKTYSSDYVNADGFNLDIYSELVKNIWKTYDNIEYDLEIKNITIQGDKAIVESLETSFAEIDIANSYSGELKSESNLVYNLRKTES